MTNDLRVTRAQRGVFKHLKTSFPGHELHRHRFSDGTIGQRVPDFAVAVVAPGPKLSLWAFVSLGCWDAVHEGEHGLEFVLLASEFDIHHMTTIERTAYYHAGPASQRLDDGHTVPIGESWIEGSSCDHMLVSSPYPLGLEFEYCRWRGGHARLLWLMPITKAERDFKVSAGREALERRFEELPVAYWDPGRESVV